MKQRRELELDKYLWLGDGVGKSGDLDALVFLEVVGLFTRAVVLTVNSLPNMASAGLAKLDW